MSTVENETKLLWNCANSLDAGNHTKKLLKSYYLTTCRRRYEYELQMPKEKFSPARMCKRCCSFWTENEFELKLRSQNIKTTSKVKRLVEKLKSGQKMEKNHLLTSKQKRRAKWLEKRITKNIELTCKFCKHKTLIALQKSKKQKIKVEAQKCNELTNINVKKQKKHGNRDKNAGLNLSKISDKISKRKILPNLTSKVKIDDEIETNHRNVGLKSKSNAVGAVLTPTKSKKTKKKKVGTKQPTNQTTTVKFQSKTQQQNSLLQLAALLKTQAMKMPINTQKNRLNALLK